MLEAASVFLLSILVGSIMFGSKIDIDGLLHIMAASSWAEGNGFRIADGCYTRAAAFTVTIGSLFYVFGENVNLAWIPPLFAGALISVILFVWVRKEIGIAAAWITVILFILAPISLEMFRFIRFYTLHSLAFLVGSIVLYELVQRRRALLKDALLASAAVLAFGLAHHLQKISLVGFIALGAWLVMIAAPAAFALAKDRPVLRWVLAGIGILGLAAITVFLQSDFAEGLYRRYRTPLNWNIDTQNTVEFYYAFLREYYAMLIALLPVSIVIGLVKRPRFTIFAGTVFLVTVGLLSFAGPKADRYIYFVMPFFFALTSIVLVEIGRLVLSALSELLNRIGWTVLTLGYLRIMLYVVVLIGLFGWLIQSNGSRYWIVGLLTGTVRTDVMSESWQRLPELLEDYLDDDRLIVVNREERALYFIGDYDIAVTGGAAFDQTAGMANDMEFVVDPRFGRLLITSTDSMLRLMACHPSGLIIAETDKWRVNPMWGISNPVADMIEARTQRIPIPENLRILAFAWDQPVQGTGHDCNMLDLRPVEAPPCGWRQVFEAGLFWF